MENKTTAKDFFINLGAIIALYTSVFSLVNLLFTVINTAYPQIEVSYWGNSSSISVPVATLIVFYPIFIILMWLLEKDFRRFPEKQNSGIHKWLTYLTLFVSGLVIAIDLIMVLYYFLDGQELTIGFLLKVLVLLVIASGIFSYYISDVRMKLTARGRNIYRVVSLVIIIASIIWGFSVLGSPRTSRLYKYDEQKVMDLDIVNSYINSFYELQKSLPKTLEESETVLSSNYSSMPKDPQTGAMYTYKVTGKTTYQLCANFNKATRNFSSRNNVAYPAYSYFNHPAGEFCFNKVVNKEMYEKAVPVPPR